jgi:hypothetical protein
MSIPEEAVNDWNEDLEKVVKRDGEQCQSLFWMHNAASEILSLRNDMIQIPAIVLASSTGFLSATSVLLPPVAIGAMSLSVGILNTVNTYFRFSQTSEAHRMTAQLYMKAYKIIETELALPIHQREYALKILADLRDTMVRISEIAPKIPSEVIQKYNKTFKNSSVAKPIIAEGIKPISICEVSEQKDDIITVSVSPVVEKVDISSNTIEKWPSAISHK